MSRTGLGKGQVPTGAFLSLIQGLFWRQQRLTAVYGPWVPIDKLKSGFLLAFGRYGIVSTVAERLLLPCRCFHSAEIWFSLRSKGLTLFDSAHTLFECVLLHRLCSSIGLDSLLRAGMMGERTLVAWASIMCCGRETDFVDRLAIQI